MSNINSAKKNPLKNKGDLGARGGLFQSLRQFFRPAKPKEKQRQFAAGGGGRLMEWVEQITSSMNQANHVSLVTIRRRSRAAAINDPYIAKFISLVADNVVGNTGLTLQSLHADATTQKAIEAAWYKWCDDCDISGRMDFTGICQAAIRAMARDGEFLVRKIINENGLQLQALDTNRIATDINDTSKNIVNGIELDAFGAPIAYYIYPKNPDDSLYSGIRSANRILAEQILHGFIPLWDEQVRGLPWLHASLVWLTHINKYVEAAIVASRIGAAKMIFYTQNMELKDNGAIGSSDVPEEIHPGSADVLPAGVDMKSFDPSYPHEQFGEFMKVALKGISTGIGINYNSISNDRADANFSSIRTGSLEDRDHWMVIQNIFIRQFARRVFRAWLGIELMKGSIFVNGKALRASEFKKLAEHKFIARRWDWVDPEKDINADILACSVALKDPYEIAAKNGGDLHDNIDAIARAMEYAKSKGVELQFKKQSSADSKVSDENGTNKQPIEKPKKE